MEGVCLRQRQQVEAKFRSLAGAVLTPSRAEVLLQRLWHLEDVADIGEIVRLTKIQGRARWYAHLLPDA